MEEYPTPRFRELMHLVDGYDGRASGEHDRVLSNLLDVSKENRQQPRIELENNKLIFKDRTGAIVSKITSYGPENLENLERAYLCFQVAYEDAKAIGQGAYLQWSEQLMKRGLELSANDKSKILAINDRFKGFKSA